MGRFHVNFYRQYFGVGKKRASPRSEKGGGHVSKPKATTADSYQRGKDNAQIYNKNRVISGKPHLLFLRSFKNVGGIVPSPDRVKGCCLKCLYWQAFTNHNSTESKLMKRLLSGVIIIASVAAVLILAETSQNSTIEIKSYDEGIEDESKDEKAKKAIYIKARWQYEYDLLKDPRTGKIPYDIRNKELALARSIPVKRVTGSGILGVENLNNYIAAGPTNIGGRTRALAYDRRYNGTSNQVIITGCVSGGILRSSDGGNTWTRVSPENDIHNLVSLVQDPRPGSENIWYAGGGESFGSSADAPGAAYLSNGVWKSVNNGVTWTKTTATVTDIDGNVLTAGALEAFDHPFDIIHRIAINPVNGDVYVAGHRRLIKSTDGGSSWTVVFAGTSPATVDNGQLDVAITPSGKFYVAVNGGFVDREKRGIWTSTNSTTWTRLAGGPPGSADSIPNWRANDPAQIPRRILLAIPPSNETIVYTIYENGLSQDDDSNPKPEIDMFKYDATGNTWTNLSANMPDFTGQMDNVDPLDTQDGYNMVLVVKPDDPNVVFVGGTNLFRSTNGFTSTTATTWIGGYQEDFPAGLKIYPASHPDMHNLAFMPNNGGSNPGFLKAICANDGGIQSTNNVMATGGISPVSWAMLPNYQTLQYYHVAIDPTPGENNFIGGAQDNGTQLRVIDANPNEQIRLLGGDGGAAGIATLTGSAFTLYGSVQLGEIYRDKTNVFTKIKPDGLTPFPGLSEAFGEFVTLFKLDFDNTEDLYYVNFNRLFRTKNASTVTGSTWEELTGVRSTVNPGNPSSGTNIGIRSLELTRGPYNPSHVLYIGTSNGKLYRLNDPRNAAAGTAAVNITPSGIPTSSSIADIAVNPNNDDEVLIVISNYGATSIFHTTNAKSASPTWKNAEGNLDLPSIRSCMIVVKKDGSNNPVTEYYVGTSVGLYSTLSMSGTVAWVREGGNVLNYAVITSLDYRPQDNTLLVGTHGNGMYYATTGTPDFRPSQGTGIDDPIRNDKNFIKLAAPTFVKNRIEYQIGNMFTVKKIWIKVTNLKGQVVYNKQTAYQSGQVNVSNLSKGAYILTITSEDYKQQHVTKFVKE